MSKIFGGSKSRSRQQSQSSGSNVAFNRAYGDISAGLGSMPFDAYRSGTSAIMNELSGGYDAYRQNTGFDFMRLLGLNRVGGAASGRGIFNSGATLKALQEYDNNYNQQFYQNYLNNLFAQAQLGNQGIAQLSGAGGVSSGQSQSSSSGYSRSSSSNGMGGFLGTIISAPAISDRRLKSNIVKIGALENGLDLYSYTYIWDEQTPVVGVMADEVAKIKPEALGPEVAGYQTVDYSKVI